MRREQRFLLLAVLLIIAILTITALTVFGDRQQNGNPAAYMPMVTRPAYEVRALWITRYDWGVKPTPDRIQQIVDDTALAGFNTLYFQVRGEADAFYQSNWEPWSRLLTDVLGQDPGWDPLGTLIELAHARNIQVHAYINVYPVWLGCGDIDPNTSPQHLYYKLDALHGRQDGKLRGLQWNTSDQVICSGDYRRASPASLELDKHLMLVASDLVDKYAIDGIHLDHIRYASGASCDPVSLCRYNGLDENCDASALSCPLPGSAAYKDWQRVQINGTVGKFYDQIITPAGRKLWLSAAVWPVYSTGVNQYYQDPLAWLQDAHIDSISPMIYLPFAQDAAAWSSIVSGFQSQRQGRYIVPGIDAEDGFAGIAARIEAGRSLGTAGHAIFSYGAMKSRGYFDDLANGPYAESALVPNLPWHP